MDYDELQLAARTLESGTGRTHSVVVVLGSGMSGFASKLPHSITVPYEEIPGFPIPTVTGHGGTAVSCAFAGGNALILAGRVHLYEGWPVERIVFGVRSAVMSGCRIVILTNAAGGAGAHLEAGDLALITDHISLTGQSPLIGPNDDRLGPRFPDMSEVYSRRLRALAHDVAQRDGVTLKEGVYAWFAGPAYETPAEVQMAIRLGADLVGMSTVPEAVASRHLGAEVLGLSLVTNLAAGISPTALSHEDVEEAATAAASRVEALLGGLLESLLR